MRAPKGKYAWTATVGEKGQIVIPKQARELFGIRPGDTVLLLGDEKKGIAIPPGGRFAALFEQIFSDGSDESRSPDEVGDEAATEEHCGETDESREERAADGGEDDD